jgi:hypothetical protein
MKDWDELGRALDELAASGNVEVREDGEWLANLAGLHCEFRQVGNAAIVHFWSDTGNLTRRVVCVRELAENLVVLDVQRFGRTKPGRLEILRTESSRPAGRVAREQFRARFRRMLAEQFPDATIDSLTAAPDLEHSFSGIYVRGRLHEGERAWTVLAVSGEEGAAAIYGILAFGILWLDWTRNHANLRAVAGLRLFIPEGKSRQIRERVVALANSARTEVFEYSEPDGRMHKMDLADVGNLESSLRPHAEMEASFAAARESFARAQVIADARSSEENAFRFRWIFATDEVALCFRGLEFARWTRRGILFGLGDQRVPLTPRSEPRLERLLRQLMVHRNPDKKEMNHGLYRAAPEKWLESIVLEDLSKLDAQLDSKFCYPQVPALAGGDRGVIDLLGVTRRGRLAVIELKTSEDIQLPLQAVDYWLRVRRHQQEGNFRRLGYFPGIEIDSQPPLVLLVSPGLRFHPATDTLLKSISPEISVARIGLTENWRREIRVVLRQ